MVSACALTDDAAASTAITALEPAALDAWIGAHPRDAAWLRTCGWRGEPGSHLFLPTPGDEPPRMLFAPPPVEATWTLGGLPLALPEGNYHLDDETPSPLATSRALGWALGAYQFGRYKTPRRAPARLRWPAGADREKVNALARGVHLARDLINTPAEDMGPDQLADAARLLAADHGARVQVVRGDELLVQGYPTIHLVGRASPRPPQLIDLRWGSADAPALTLVGKGVCFDTGGLDIKTHDGMLEMKKDMGGAAVMLGLAAALMALQTPVRLRLLIPAVDNAIAGDAMRPRDIVRTRAGKTVEIGFTDAEGRLVLADALAEACREPCDLVIDAATLTGSAKATLGSEVQALFSDDDALAEAFVRSSFEVGDPLWRLPIWRGYRKRIDSPVADFGNVAKGLFADAIVATLFLSEFVPRSQRWVHLDIMAMNGTPRPGRPEGGEATGLLALHSALAQRYSPQYEEEVGQP